MTVEKARDQTAEHIYLVRNADPKGDLGDFKVYVQDSLEDAASVADEILSECQDPTLYLEIVDVVVVRTTKVRWVDL